MAKTKRGSAVWRIAAKIREDATKLADGELLGSEDELVSRYGVSRPTLRQAASLVVQEQLLTVRRGMGGGYFARAPNANAVGRMAALYLRYHRASRAEILAAFMPLRMELARLAVANDNDALREELQQFLAHEETFEEYASFRDFVLAERKFNLLLGRLSGNQALGLFMEILLDLSAIIDRGEDMYRNNPTRVADLRRERNALGKAILEREEDFAIAIARRSSRMSAQRHQEDLAQRKKVPDADIIHMPEQSAA